MLIYFMVLRKSKNQPINQRKNGTRECESTSVVRKTFIWETKWTFPKLKSRQKKIKEQNQKTIACDSGYKEISEGDI